jgi:hypothetical protein
MHLCGSMTINGSSTPAAGVQAAAAAAPAAAAACQVVHARQARWPFCTRQSMQRRITHKDVLSPGEPRYTTASAPVSFNMIMVWLTNSSPTKVPNTWYTV